MSPRIPAQARWTDAHGNLVDEEDRGLGYDLQTLVGRRRLLGLFGGVSAAALLAACSGATETASSGLPSNTQTGARTGTETGELTEIPDETGGPYPGDGSNGVNVLEDSGIVRTDIRSSFGDSTTTAEGVPLTVRLTVRDASTGDAIPGAAVYLWHCDREGRYSLYAQGLEQENYLRGVQSVDGGGTVTFGTIVPGCYSGRWPHIHFEVYGSAADATGAGPIVKTSQLALPKEMCTTVYGEPGYEQSAGNLSGMSLSSDNVFGDDGAIHQLASVSGDPATGYTASLTLGV